MTDHLEKVSFLPFILARALFVLALIVSNIKCQRATTHVSDLQRLHQDIVDHSEMVSRVIAFIESNSQIRNNSTRQLSNALMDVIETATFVRDEKMKDEEILEKVQKNLKVVQGTHHHTQKVFCTYSGWASGWKEPATFYPSDIDPYLCTHISYSFAKIDGADMRIGYSDPTKDVTEGQYKQLADLRNVNPQLRVLVAIGGGNDGSMQLSLVSRTYESRKIFAESVEEFIRMEDYDGLEINWKWPTYGDGIPEDKENFIALLKELRERFDKFGWILTATVSSDPETIDKAYNITGLEMYLDLMSIESYQLYKLTDGILGLHNALYPGRWESPELSSRNAAAAVEYYLKSGFPANKLLLGIGLMGIPFTMTQEDPTALGTPVLPTSFAGPHLGAEGFLAYYDTCEMLNRDNWSLSWDVRHETSFMFKENKFVGFDDEVSIGAKIKFAQKKGLAGLMVRSVDIDDFKGLCGPKYPLLKAINKHLELYKYLRP